MESGDKLKEQTQPEGETPDTNCEEGDHNHHSHHSHGTHPSKGLKKVVSAGEGLDSGILGKDAKHEKLLPKEAYEQIKQSHHVQPLGGNYTLADYRTLQLKMQKNAEENMLNKDISRVLVISTGGTFCMVKTPKGYMVQRGLANRLKKFHSFYDDEYAKLLDLPEDTLISPETPYHKRVQFNVLEFENLIDSSNIMVSDWVQISKTIEENYKNYDGFVVLHGTDTMAYTASALSFMLENLNKTVIVTGSQIPLLELKNDAVDNLLGSLLVAGHFNIPEVMVFFANKLLRGNRVTKESTVEMTAFNTPNFAPLGVMGVEFDIHWEHIQRHVYDGHINAFTTMDNNISLISISPLLNLKIIENILFNSKAVIISAYGMGNIPSNNKDLLNMLSRAINDEEIIVVILTQCHRGTVNDLYEAGRALTDLGAVLGQDMTLECCYAKLSYLLGKGYSNEKIKTMMTTSMRGELTDVKRQKDLFSLKNSNLVRAIAKVLNSQQAEDYKLISQTIQPVLVNSIASTGDIKQLQQLKEEGVDFNCVDYRARSALHIACIHGYMEVVKFLIKEKVNLDKIDSTGTSPLYHAIMRGHEDIAMLLYFKGASVHAPTEKIAKLLCICGFKGDILKVRLLKECEADIEICDYDLRSVGHLAAAEKHWDLLSYLAQKTHFNFQIKDRWGKTPLDEIQDPEIRSRYETMIREARSLHGHGALLQKAKKKTDEEEAQDVIKENSSSDENDHEGNEETAKVSKLLQKNASPSKK